MKDISLEKLVNRNTEDKTKLYRISTLLRKKSTQERWEYEGEDTPLLKRVLTWLDVLSCSICMTIGAGIFVIAGSVAHDDAGPAVVISFFLAGIAAMIPGFCYSEFSARVPVSGSTYSFTYVALGEFVGWICGWVTIIEYTLAPAAIAQGIAETCVKVASMLNVFFPASLFQQKITNTISVFPLSAALVILLTLMVLFGGIKGSAIFCRVMSFVNVSTIIFISIAGLFFIDTRNWSNFAPFGFTGILKGASKVLFAYVGFENCTTLATEVKNPKKNMPKGVIGTLCLTISIYLVSSLVITGMVNFQHISITTPFIAAFDAHSAYWAATMTAVGSLLCMTTAMISSLLGLPRILFQMSKDGLLGASFSKLNRFKVPYTGTLLVGAATCLLTLFMNLEFLNDMLCCGVLINYTMVNVSAISMRFADSEIKMERKHIIIIMATVASCIPVGLSVDWKFSYFLTPICLIPFVVCVVIMYRMMPIALLSHPPNVDSFICPLVPFLPCLGILFNVVMLVQLNILPFVQVLAWASVGSCVYFLFGIKHSKLNYIDAADQFYY